MRQRTLSASLIVVFLTFCLTLFACASHSNKVNHTADTIAHKNQFEKKAIKTCTFTLASFQKKSTGSNDLIIYIEGDGRTWIRRDFLSDNPTPKNPMALKLAVLDTHPANIAYLARPCQYTPLSEEPHCNPAIWSHQRFSKTVIDSMNEAIDVLKAQTHSKTVHLVGFSGGGTVALLIAAKRHDMGSLKTIAGDLNPTALSQYHKTSPLVGSLDPNRIRKKLMAIPQQHFSGEKDDVVPPFIAQQFASDLKKLGHTCCEAITIPHATHHEKWTERWPQLQSKPFLCSKNPV